MLLFHSKKVKNKSEKEYSVNLGGGGHSEKLIFIIIIGILLFITGVSYALWQLTLQQESTNVITTGCFKIEFSDVNPIGLENAYPIEDEEGKNLTPYEFTITNTCDSNAAYQINLEILNDTTLENLDYIKVMLDEEKSILTSNEDVTTTLNDAISSYKLKTGYLKANEEKTFSLRLWMDENTPTREEFMNKIFLSKITIIANHIVDENPPEIVATTTNALNSITVDASESFDEEVGIETYYFRLEEEGWNASAEPMYTFYNLDYQEYIIEIQAEDNVGNLSEIKSVKEFPKVRATDYVNSLNGNGEVVNDETIDDNIRYIGVNPKNYIDIGDRDVDGNTILWRIIGSMNNIKTNEEDEVGETRLKLIRAESIGEYSWDSSASNINDGAGINEWSQADANILLNDYYYNNKADQTCYNGQNNATVDCDFSGNGLSADAKNLIEEVVWNTGANDGTIYTYNNIITSQFYELERSNDIGKICTSGTYCNDKVTRLPMWKGIIGLIYPSDYGYATSGGTTVNRYTCIKEILYNWKENLKDCQNNNWLYSKNGFNRWFLTPYAYSSHSDAVFFGFKDGYVSYFAAYRPQLIYPTLYLKSNVNIISGIGEELNPYVVSLQ